MNITNIKIKNFTIIEELELNLKVNTNKIEQKVQLGQYKYINEKKYALAYASAIMGRNSIGKSSILSALSMVSAFHGKIISNTASSVLMENAIKNKDLKREFDNSIGLDHNAGFQNYVSWLSNYIETDCKNREGRFFSELLIVQQILIKNIFKTYSKDGTKNITIEVEFDKNNERIIHNFSLTPNGVVNSTVKNIGSSKKMNPKTILAVSKYWSSIVVPAFSIQINDTIKDDVSTFANSVNNIQGFYNSLNTILWKKGEQKLTKILRMCDPRVTSIKVIEVNNQKIVEKIYLDNKPKGVYVLSDGTKKFIDILASIFKAEHMGGKLVLIDEIELNMHKELVNALKAIMISLFERKGIQFIFTTHNPIMLEEFIDHKQIFSLDIVDDKHIATRISSFMKPMQSIVKQYQKGFVSPYPDEELIRNIASEIV